MPPTTRGATKQTKLEDVGAGKQEDIKAATQSTNPKARSTTSSNKRKATEQPKESKDKPAKKAKSSNIDDGDHENTGSIIINRAPVLELWTSCVAHFLLHPSISWSTCLSAGGAVATITAISKGRSIGKIEKPDPGEAAEKKQQRKEKAEKEGLDEIEVMGFKLSLDNEGQAMVSGKAKKAGEEALRKKYGGPEVYGKVRKAFEEALEGWKGREEELDGRAFRMYEEFRPSIPSGQTGWGRKGQLNLETVREVISGS